MAHPKSRISKQRKRKRRTHKKAEMPQLATCRTTGEPHIYHRGVWVDGNIIELKGNGLIRGISPKRFLQERSGENIYIACDNKNNPLIQSETADRAVSRLFTYSEYDVMKNNCHKFVWQCISDDNLPLTRFSELNQKMAEHFASEINWHPINY